jgi:hypothetical protein
MAAQREGRRITQMQYFLQNGGLQALGLSKANFAFTEFYEVELRFTGAASISAVARLCSPFARRP